MLKKHLSKNLAALALGVVLTAQMGCRKQPDIDVVVGEWRINWMTDLKATVASYDLNRLCGKTNGTVIPVDVAATVLERDFRLNNGQNYTRVTAQSRSNVPMVYGDINMNRDANSTRHIRNCEGYYVSVYNRAWAGELFGVDYNYGSVSTDAAGRCVLSINKDRSYRIVVLTAEMKDYQAKVLDANTGAKERTFATLSYDCQNGNVSRQVFTEKADIDDKSIGSASNARASESLWKNPKTTNPANW